MSENVIPHEPFVRAWLMRSASPAEEVDELVQDCYCRFAMLDEVDHIERPDIYFYSMARRLLIRKRRREKIVPIGGLSDLADYAPDDAPSPEREVAGQIAFERMAALMAELPDRCRRVIEMRKFDGLSQREIAATLGISESIVENDVQIGVRRLRQAWRSFETLAEDRLSEFERGGRRA